MPRHHILCCNDVFCAAALYFVPWQCSSCCNHVFGAAAKLFVLRQISLCCGKALCAMAKLFVPQQQNDALWHCVALFFVSWLEMTCLSIAWHSVPSFLCALARNDLLLHSVACCIMQHHYSLCRGFIMLQHVSLCHGKKQCAAFRAIILCSAARNDVLLHSVTLHLWCCLLCHGCKDEQNSQPVWHWLPRWHNGSYFGLVGCCVFCRGCCFF